ncbi:MAG: hypothetical protein J7K84_07860 [Deltaproteobacteria bacterium]|nr:hypothetical protein [Deltaproteobacteria bacterium]
MNIDSRLILLDKIYKIYDDFIESIDVACKKFCSVCCTCNVTITSLESYKILFDLSAAEKKLLQIKLAAKCETQHFIPQTTTNRLAVLCAQDKDIPVEEIDSSWGECPLLTNNACPVYNKRPFGCRAFVSKHNCTETGYAEIDPFVLSVNTLFLQFIEHIDCDGYSGNIMDVMLSFEVQEKNWRNKQISVEPGSRLIKNHPVNILMVPPEHRSRIMPLFKKLKNITI